MSLSPRDIEEVIARRFGELSNEGEPFTVEYLEKFVDKMRVFDREKREEEERELQQALAKKRKPQLVCPNPQCRNIDEEYFEKDERVAQVTCMRCGTVVAERQVYDGEWVRKFEGEVNPTQHGPPPNLKFSSGRNLQTGMAEMPGVAKRQARDLALTQKSVELNLSSMMDTRKKHGTRIGYKDNDKEKVFAKMQEINESIQLHGTILDRAETIFAKYRDAVEQLNDRYEIAAACLILAFREKLTEEGEASVRQLSTPTAAPQLDSNNVLQFRCKYCDFPFSLKRDKIFHQKTCDQRPADTPSGGNSSSSNGEQTGDDRSKRAKTA